MTLHRTRAFSRHAALVVGALLVLVGVTACAADGGPGGGGSSAEAAATETPIATPTEEPSSAADDEVTCNAFGDVQTILHNAQAAFYDERMTERELDGWTALASRVLGNIPAADDGRVSDALAAVKEAVPAVQAPLGPSNILSREWDVPGAELLAACEAAGFPVITNGFIGG